MGQQGLTAAVSCQEQDLNAESDPPLSYWIEPANITLFNQTYTVFQVSTVCAGEPTYSGVLTWVCGTAVDLFPSAGHIRWK